VDVQYAVVCEARANTKLNKMELIEAVAKLVPKPHSVDLKNPDKTILVQIVKVCPASVSHFISPIVQIATFHESSTENAILSLPSHDDN
jgi:tRNA acetyltransferase TAN1